MKKQWQILALGDISKFQGGSQPPKSAFVSSPRDGYVRLLQIRDFKSDNKAVYIPESPKNRICTESDVMIGRYGASVGQIHRGKAGAYNVALIRTIPDEHRVDRDYFYFYLKSDLFQRRLSAVADRSAQAGFSKSDIASFKVPLPSLPEQKRIVAILDEAFDGIATAVANAEKNLANARELFRSALHLCFDQNLPETSWMLCVGDEASNEDRNDQEVKVGTQKTISSTRGRAATDRVIEGELSLSVGASQRSPRVNWMWSRLTDFARLESGHTPSRRHPEYWDGDIPWIGIKDARTHHGQVIHDTTQHTNPLGLENSAARLLPKGTVCLSRTASVGYVVVMGAEMATSQDFVNWVCSEKLDPQFLKYLFIAEGAGFAKYSSGAVHQTIYFPEVKAFHICHPRIEVQSRIVEFLDKFRDEAQRLETIYQQKIAVLADLKQSLLHRAFSGAL